MNTRLAVVVDSIYHAETDGNIKRIMLFEADDDLITAVDEDIISLDNINYLCLWLLGKQAKRLYCDGIGTEEKQLLEKVGVVVYPLKEIRDHPILKVLLLKEKVFAKAWCKQILDFSYLANFVSL